MSGRPAITALGIALLALSGTARAAERAPMTIGEAIAFALLHHPGLQVEDAALAGSAAQVEAARAGYLPRLDLSLQLVRGTGNVLRGALLPLPGVPAVSGPPTGRDLDSGAFGTIAAAGVSWDAIGLVRRMALVDAALADQGTARAALGSRRLAVAFAAADQFIETLIQAEIVRAARASVERARVFSTMVQALVEKELRPGADGSRAAAELALASTQLIRAEQAEALSRAALAQALGAAGERVEITQGKLLDQERASAPGAVRHPLLIEAAAAIRAAEARRRVADLQYLPRLDLVAALWVRGSGLASETLPPSPGDGLVPDTPNWAAGLVLSFSALEIIAARARARVEAARVKAASARRAEVEQAVRAQLASAQSILDGARRVVGNTPVAVAAARAVERQATARYRAGLTTAIEVAEAQRLLSQTEIDDAVARLGVRRAMLLLARAVGDLGPFLRDLGEGGW